MQFATQDVVSDNNNNSTPATQSVAGEASIKHKRNKIKKWDIYIHRLLERVLSALHVKEKITLSGQSMEVLNTMVDEIIQKYFSNLRLLHASSKQKTLQPEDVNTCTRLILSKASHAEAKARAENEGKNGDPANPGSSMEDLILDYSKQCVACFDKNKPPPTAEQLERNKAGAEKRKLEKLAKHASATPMAKAPRSIRSKSRKSSFMTPSSSRKQRLAAKKTKEERAAATKQSNEINIMT